MPAPNRYHALDHIVVVLFENRSLDNVLGHLYRPEDGKNFDGVIGKDLSNPIPEWAEHGADRKVVPYTVATDMDSPNPDSGEEYYHTNTQLYNTLDEHNRLKIGEAVAARLECAATGGGTDDGWVCHRLHLDLHRRDRSQPRTRTYSSAMLRRRAELHSACARSTPSGPSRAASPGRCRCLIHADGRSGSADVPNAMRVRLPDFLVRRPRAPQVVRL